MGFGARSAFRFPWGRGLFGETLGRVIDIGPVEVRRRHRPLLLPAFLRLARLVRSLLGESRRPRAAIACGAMLVALMFAAPMLAIWPVAAAPPAPSAPPPTPPPAAIRIVGVMPGPAGLIAAPAEILTVIRHIA